MFERSAKLYDAIYGWKDYAAETGRLSELIASHKTSPGNFLLDVACGTGGHIPYLRERFEVEGLDLNEEFVRIARERHPGVTIHAGDMVETDLGRQFDVVTCLFSAIGYVKTRDRLDLAVANMARHLAPGGVLIIEPWLSPDTWKGGRQPASINVAEEDDFKAVRMIVWEQDGTIVSSDFHYLVGTPDGVEHFTERHEVGLFTDEEYCAAFERAGLEVTHDKEGLIGRGLFIGTWP